ncbi:MAG: hypothetical protein IKV76_00570 [Clostridia bacterium]|nr:hypothetical protein [Clostridia bacterium]
MARCPQCGYKLSLVDVKAECPVCKVNIPNYKWEDRLEADAENAEASFKIFRRKTAAIKSCLFGSKFRVARFVLTFAPLLFFLFPMFIVNTSLPFDNGTQSVSMLGLILDIVNGNLDIGSLLSLMSLELSGKAFTVLYISLVLVVLGIVAGVLNFFVILISGLNYHAKGNIVLCVLSTVFFIAAIVCIIVSSSMFASVVSDVISVKLSFSLFVGILFFVINITMNSIARKQFAAEKKELGKRIRQEEGIEA